MVLFDQGVQTWRSDPLAEIVATSVAYRYDLSK